MLSHLQNNRITVLGRIARASRAAGRDPATVRLLAVTKGVTPDVAAALARLGQVDLAENRLAGLEEKVAAFRAHDREVRWHFVGHLQRNKARRVVRIAHAIHSVDSIPLLETLDRLAREEGVRPGIFLQVKLSREDTKHGFSKDGVPGAVLRAMELATLPLLGLMTMAPLIEGPAAPAAARRVFARLVALGESLPAEAFEGGRPLYSMGMSADLEQAIAEGAHVVRVGTALFEGLAPPAARADEAGGKA